MGTNLRLSPQMATYSKSTKAWWYDGPPTTDVSDNELRVKLDFVSQINSMKKRMKMLSSKRLLSTMSFVSKNNIQEDVREKSNRSKQPAGVCPKFNGYSKSFRRWRWRKRETRKRCSVSWWGWSTSRAPPFLRLHCCHSVQIQRCLVGVDHYNAAGLMEDAVIGLTTYKIENPVYVYEFTIYFLHWRKKV